eukprot:SAG31_NODE_18265_length_642_cov_0.646409_1_plen_94_part_00
MQLTLFNVRSVQRQAHIMGHVWGILRRIHHIDKLPHHGHVVARPSPARNDFDGEGSPHSTITIDSSVTRLQLDQGDEVYRRVLPTILVDTHVN